MHWLSLGSLLTGVTKQLEGKWTYFILQYKRTWFTRKRKGRLQELETRWHLQSRNRERWM